MPTRQFSVGNRSIRFFCDDLSDIARYYSEVIAQEEYNHLPEGSGWTVIDIGANLGTFSTWIYDRARVIYAVEASFANYLNLKRMVMYNGLFKIKPFHLAIAGSNGERRLHRAGDCGGYTIFGHDETAERVDAVTLAWFMERECIQRTDIVKMDIEGAEAEVFNAADFPSANRLPFIIGELHVGIQDSVGRLGYTYEQKNNLFILRAS